MWLVLCCGRLFWLYFGDKFRVRVFFLVYGKFLLFRWYILISCVVFFILNESSLVVY